jgi:hypothetical protein
MKDVYVSLLLQAQIKVTVCKNPILLWKWKLNLLLDKKRTFWQEVEK